ncbi:unnamed protein product [Owenia fusiformis]|uniref:Uncharacterized protein n=1 Tax=Owenia fusiformis TaxID=6347 RepID=A0A8J1U2R7_OWEFU|nr:unnamed protein product [Owenia fusiformis]
MTKIGLFVFIFLTIVTTLALGLKQCKNSRQCGKRACCVADNQPIGKRDLTSVLLKPEPYGGHCERLGELGDACLMATFDPSQGMYWKCPCRSGLTCIGSGMIEVPLGEIGKCSYSKEV